MIGEATVLSSYDITPRSGVIQPYPSPTQVGQGRQRAQRAACRGGKTFAHPPHPIFPLVCLRAFLSLVGEKSRISCPPLETSYPPAPTGRGAGGMAAPRRGPLGGAAGRRHPGGGGGLPSQAGGVVPVANGRRPACVPYGAQANLPPVSKLPVSLC